MIKTCQSLKKEKGSHPDTPGWFKVSVSGNVRRKDTSRLGSDEKVLQQFSECQAGAVTLLFDPQSDESNAARDSLFLFLFFCSQSSDILFRSFRNPALRAAGTPPSVVLYLQKRERERPCCCLCSSNEMPSDLFMNYLFGTAPLCSVHFFSPLWSHVAQ